MKQFFTIIGLLVVVATANAQSKKHQESKPQEQVYSVQFTEQGLGLINAKIDTAVYKITNSCIPSRDGSQTVVLLSAIKNMFNQAYQQQAKKDSTGKK